MSIRLTRGGAAAARGRPRGRYSPSKRELAELTVASGETWIPEFDTWRT